MKALVALTLAAATFSANAWQNSWTVTDPFDVTNRQTITQDAGGGYTVRDTFDVTRQRKVRPRLDGGHDVYDPFDVTNRRVIRPNPGNHWSR